MAATDNSKWFRAAIALAVAVVSATTAISICVLKKKSRDWKLRVRELEISLKASLDQCAAERKGRIRAQQAARKALTQGNSENSNVASYPMTPIGIVKSCFSTRNGTPRQPLLVPLARGCLTFDTSQVPPAALDGLAEYSHCWILYVFHLNTNLEKLWKEPANLKFKAKVRVPRLKGGRIGVFGTRSPHRPCPIGLTVAKVEAVQGHTVLLSGVDLVDGTPVLDIKPYLPYCDSIQEATVAEWVEGDDMLVVASVHFSDEFSSTLANCWETAEKTSLYASPEEFQSLIKQVLSYDIRSLSQLKRPHNASSELGNPLVDDDDPASDLEDDKDENVSHIGTDQGLLPPPSDVTYHLILESLDISYRIDCGGNVFVEKATTLPSNIKNNIQNRSNCMIWRNKLG
ncbi:Uncharacterized domain UPF0066 [Macleaya cordata]|uniref:Uncharacterized domain UPF0066 n=1 Tax=Macleaya cordata TaxID=56857 RepID=A0A200PZM6_MACCD|nr:Uncharacterized domain UPF0066 [Macleaya cordata]